MRNESFPCENCGKLVEKHPSGSARNHCPFCLHSKHLDQDFPGDRASECMGIMRPIRFENRKNKGMVIIHQCSICKKEIPNKLSDDDQYLPVMRTLAANEAIRLDHQRLP